MPEEADWKEDVPEDGASFRISTRTSIRELSEEVQEVLHPGHILNLISALVGVGYEETGIDNTSGFNDVDFAVKTIETLVRQTLASDEATVEVVTALQGIFERHLSQRVIKDL